MWRVRWPRRRWLLAAGGFAVSGLAHAQAAPFAQVVPDYRLAFPRDHAAHPEFRTEWWYLTGCLQVSGRDRFGFQLTFFRTATGRAPSPSRFSATQLIMLHAALTDLAGRRLHHYDRVARAAFDLAGADPARGHVWLDDASLTLVGDTYHGRFQGQAFDLRLGARASQPPLLQGAAGFSRKGPLPQQASYYYSRPQLSVIGDLRLGTVRMAVEGRAWLDHEWSSEVMTGDAVGWDWAGINLDSGGALMVFQMRDATGSALWADAQWQHAGGARQSVPRADIRIEPLGFWHSPHSQARYPAALRIRLGQRVLELAPLLADQEVDARRSTGTVYWEGISELREAGRRIGVGYMELTGYWRPVRF